jgi:hypothetical protein
MRPVSRFSTLPQQTTARVFGGGLSSDPSEQEDSVETDIVGNQAQLFDPDTQKETSFPNMSSNHRKEYPVGYPPGGSNQLLPPLMNEMDVVRDERLIESDHHIHIKSLPPGFWVAYVGLLGPVCACLSLLIVLVAR